jgi:hypothetical protein
MKLNALFIFEGHFIDIESFLGFLIISFNKLVFQKFQKHFGIDNSLTKLHFGMQHKFIHQFFHLLLKVLLLNDIQIALLKILLDDPIIKSIHRNLAL